MQTSITYTGRTVLSDTKYLCNDYLCQDSFNLVTGFRGETCPHRCIGEVHVAHRFIGEVRVADRFIGGVRVAHLFIGGVRVAHLFSFLCCVLLVGSV